MKEEYPGMKYVRHENRQNACSCQQHTHEAEDHVCGCGHHHLEEKHSNYYADFDHTEHSKEDVQIGKWHLIFEKHESAVIANVYYEVESDYETSVEECRGDMAELARNIEEDGGLIGHIKMYVKEEGRSCMLSLTDSTALHRKEGSQKRSVVEGVCIVIGMKTETLKKEFEKIVKSC